MYKEPTQGLQLNALDSGEKKKSVPPPGVNPFLFETIEKVQDDVEWGHRLSFVGKGSESLVMFFEDPKHQDIVYKVNFINSVDIFFASYNGNQEAYDKALDELKGKIKERQAKIDTLRQYFGFQAVPVEKTMLVEIPFSAEVASELLGSPRMAKELTSMPPTIPAMVTVQRKVTGEKSSDLVMLSNGFPEKHLANQPDAASLYDDGYEALVSSQKRGHRPTDRKTVAGRLYPEFRQLVSEAEDQPALKTALVDFVMQAVKLGNEKGIFLDLVGRGNVYFKKQGDRFQLKLVDALLPVEMDRDTLNKTLEKMKHGFLTKLERSTVIGIVNAIRGINALAEMLDLPERITLPELEDFPPALLSEGLIPRQRPRAANAAA